MSTLLYIKASPRSNRSYSVAVADAFVESYLHSHPADRLITIDIFTKRLPDFDLPAVTAKYRIMHGEDHTPQDRAVWAKIVEMIDEFKSADKYVFAVPMWNFSIPYRLKQYIDILVQPGLTFSAGQDGSYRGLVTARPLFVCYARGGEYSSGPAIQFDMQKKYFEMIMAFIGFTDIRSIVVEPTLAAGPEKARNAKAAAIEKAREMAADF